MSGRVFEVLESEIPDGSGANVYEVDLSRCSDRFGCFDALVEPLRLPFRFGRNADALIDVMNDLSEGRHVFRIRGWERLPAFVLAELKSVLAVRQIGGFGYGSGEAQFVFVRQNESGPRDSRGPL